MNNKIDFKPLGKEAIELRTKWYNDPKINKYFDSNFRVEKTTIEKQKEWFEKYLKDEDDKRFTIYADEKPIGIVGITEVRQTDKNGELYILIGEEEYRGKGIGRKASEFILDFGFNELKLHKIWLRTNSFNTVAIELYKSLGFVEEGRQKDHVLYDGKYYDVILMGLVK